MDSFLKDVSSHFEKPVSAIIKTIMFFLLMKGCCVTEISVGHHGHQP